MHYLMKKLLLRGGYMEEESDNGATNGGGTESETMDSAEAEVSDNNAGGQQEESAAPLSGESAQSLLESLSEPDMSKADDAPADDAGNPADANAAQEKPEPANQEPATLEEQEAEALEGVKSERGRERIRATFARLKETEQVRTELESDINEFKQMVQSTKMQPEEFGQMLEFGRLMNAGDDESARVALGMLDARRAELVKRLGIDAPGVDVLDEFPDLKADVENMAMTRERALEVAKFRRRDVQAKQQQQTEQAQQQDVAQFQEQLAIAQKAAETYFDTRKNEADYAPKLQRIQEYFKDPAKVKEFVTTYQPNQWFAQIRFMYDNMGVPVVANKDPQPIRARNAHVGGAKVDQNQPMEDKLMGHIDRLGL